MGRNKGSRDNAKRQRLGCFSRSFYMDSSNNDRYDKSLEPIPSPTDYFDEPNRNSNQYQDYLSNSSLNDEGSHDSVVLNAFQSDYRHPPQYMSFSSQSSVASSWLGNIKWVSHHEEGLLGTTVEKKDSDMLEEKESFEEYCPTLLGSEIDSLTRQLLEVKKRLHPAAEQCAKSSNQLSLVQGNQTVDHYAKETTGKTTRNVSASDEFICARSQCNPFEILGERRNGGLAQRLFMNRAAIKLVNIDALLDFELTRIGTESRKRHEPFVFVDLCGAPGGFSEYVMMRKRQEQHKLSGSATGYNGYGMSLNGTNEYGQGTPWRLHGTSIWKKNMHDESEEKLNCYDYDQNMVPENYRIFHGIDGTGDVFLWDNVHALLELMKEDHIKRHSHSLSDEFDGEEQAKAHLVMADGGFDAQRDSEYQEAMTQKLVVCEVAAALTLLRKGGMLVVKMFGFQTPVIRSVLADLRTRFDNMVALKPISSRPASAERYLVCRGFHGLHQHNDTHTTNPCRTYIPSPHNSWRGGPAWRNQMFLNHLPSTSPEGTAYDWDAFSKYFDAFDRDMLRLNLKSCFSILTCLENKHHQLEQQLVEQADITRHRGLPYWPEPGTLLSVEPVNISAYRKAWQLQNLHL